MGARYEVGPSVLPRETACFRCLELRRASNFPNYGSFVGARRALALESLSPGSLNITLGYEVLALEVVKLLTGFGRAATHGSLFTFDLITLEAKAHPVLKVPRCPACGPTTDRAPVTIWRPPGRPGDPADAAP